MTDREVLDGTGGRFGVVNIPILAFGMVTCV